MNDRLSRSNFPLSKDFSASEFACRCGCGFGLSEGDLHPSLIPLAQAVRYVFGGPLHTSSGARCEAHNDAVGGTTRSKHLTGAAVDLYGGAAKKVRDMGDYGIAPTQTDMKDAREEVDRIAVIAAKLDPDIGLGIYRRDLFVHIDVRGHKARWSE